MCLPGGNMIKVGVMPAFFFIAVPRFCSRRRLFWHLGHILALQCACRTHTGHKKGMFCSRRRLFWHHGHILAPVCACRTHDGHKKGMFCSRRSIFRHLGHILVPECARRTHAGHKKGMFCSRRSIFRGHGHILAPVCACPPHRYSSILLQTSPFSLMASSTWGRASKRLREHLMESWKTMMAPGSR